ncbi:MAG: hypothetical protein GYA33_04135 [Thermogutta sp.]|nr:hypothetical protein [Thermogutta sp.]
MGEFVIRELLVRLWISSAVMTGWLLAGCAPERAAETPSSDARPTHGVDVVNPSGGASDVYPLVETCVPENAGPLGVRVQGEALIPDRVFQTKDRKDWPDYAPPEEIRVTLPEMPPDLAQSLQPNAEEESAAPARGEAVTLEGEESGDRSRRTK